MAIDAAAADAELTTPPDAEKAPQDHAANVETIGDTNESEIRSAETTLVTKRRPGRRLALVVALLMVAALGGLVGWLGFRAYDSHRSAQQHAMFLEVARHGALNLTTISYTEIDADIKRILDSSTGAFHDDFQKRAQPFIDVVKQTQSKSEGTITEAGLESVQAESAQALVAVTVTTSNADAAEQQPRTWRMRISVQRVDDRAKVSNVEFVP